MDGGGGRVENPERYSDRRLAEAFCVPVLFTGPVSVTNRDILAEPVSVSNRDILDALRNKLHALVARPRRR